MKWFDYSNSTARGVVAIGINAVGVLAIGINTIGVISIGCNSTGIISFAIGSSVAVISLAIGLIISVWASGMGIAFSVLPCYFGAGVCLPSLSNSLGFVALILLCFFELFVLWKIRVSRKRVLESDFIENRKEFLEEREKELVDINYLKRHPHTKGLVKGDIISVKPNGSIMVNIFEYGEKSQEEMFAKGPCLIQAKTVHEKMNLVPKQCGKPDRVCFFTLTAIDKPDLLDIETDDGSVCIDLKPVDISNNVDIESTGSYPQKSLLEMREFEDIVLECSDILVVPLPENSACIPLKRSYHWTWKFWEIPEHSWLWLFWVFALVIPLATCLYVVSIIELVEFPTSWLPSGRSM